MANKIKLGFWGKLISIVLAEVLIGHFILPIFSGIFNGASEQAYPWGIIILDALNLALSLLLTKYIVKFEPQDGHQIGKALVIFNVLLMVLSIYTVSGLATLSIGGIDLFFDIVRLVIGSAITYYASILILSD